MAPRQHRLPLPFPLQEKRVILLSDSPTLNREAVGRGTQTQGLGVGFVLFVESSAPHHGRKEASPCPPRPALRLPDLTLQLPACGLQREGAENLVLFLPSLPTQRKENPG